MQDFAKMELQEIQDNIRSRRNKIFLHMEEVGNLYHNLSSLYFVNFGFLTKWTSIFVGPQAEDSTEDKKRRAWNVKWRARKWTSKLPIIHSILASLGKFPLWPVVLIWVMKV